MIEYSDDEKRTLTGRPFFGGPTKITINGQRVEATNIRFELKDDLPSTEQLIEHAIPTEVGRVGACKIEVQMHVTDEGREAFDEMFRSMLAVELATAAVRETMLDTFIDLRSEFPGLDAGTIAGNIRAAFLLCKDAERSWVEAARAACTLDNLRDNFM